MQRTARRARRIAGLAVLLWGVSGLSVLAETITVFAAASLRDALGELAQVYEDQTGDDVTLVIAATSTIARQVAVGAPADVVLLADQAWVDWLILQGSLTDAHVFAGNRLVLIAAEGDRMNVPSDIPAALGDGRLALAQVDAVPAGRYAKAALTSVGLWEVLTPNIVQANNVRAALRFVERGEAGMAIGYASDLVALPMLKALYDFDAADHPSIIYSGGSLSSKGAAFMAFLMTDRAQDVLIEWGFARNGGGE